MTKQKMLETVAKIPLNELGELFRSLVQRVYEHRKQNKGYVPLEIFEACLGMGGMSVSVQIVNEVVDRDGNRIGFALKKRESSEAGAAWANLYHSTCCTARMLDVPEDALNRDTKETFGSVPTENLEFLGVTIHDEPERWSSCYTVMHRRRVGLDDVKNFVGEWKIFTETDIRSRNPEIVDHNWYLLDWVMDENREPFANVRGGYKRQK